MLHHRRFSSKERRVHGPIPVGAMEARRSRSVSRNHVGHANFGGNRQSSSTSPYRPSSEDYPERQEKVDQTLSMEKVRVFDQNDLESRDRTERLLEEIRLLKGGGDVNTRFVHKDLGETNARRRVLFPRYGSIMLQEDNGFYTSPLQPYNRFSDVTGEVCEFPLSKIIDPWTKLKKMLNPVTEDEKRARKLLVDFERTGKMSNERMPYLMTVAFMFTYIRLLEIHRYEEALLKVDRAMKISEEEVDQVTKDYYRDCWKWLRRARSKILHHQLSLTSDFTFAEHYDKRTRWLVDSERKKLYYDIVNFSKEVKLTRYKYRKREWFEKWNGALGVPGFCLKALHSLPGKDKDALNRLSRRDRTLTGWNMYDAKKRIDFFTGRSSNGNYRQGQRKYSCNNNKQQQQRPLVEGGQRT